MVAVLLYGMMEGDAALLAQLWQREVLVEIIFLNTAGMVLCLSFLSFDDARRRLSSMTIWTSLWTSLPLLGPILWLGMRGSILQQQDGKIK